MFEVPLDKVLYPTTRFFSDDLAVIMDTHGVNMLVEQAIIHTRLSRLRHLEYRLTHPLFQSEAYEIAFGEHEQMKMAIINGNGQATLSDCLSFDLSKYRN